MVKHVKQVSEMEVTIRMIEKGLTQKSIAKKLGVSHNMVNLVMRKHKRTAWLQVAIAETLGFPVLAMFPDHDPEYGLGPRPKRRASYA